MLIRNKSNTIKENPNSREQSLFQETKQKLLCLLEQSRQTILEFIPSNYLNLDKEQISETTKHIESFYTSFKTSASNCQDWVTLIGSVDEHSWYSYYDGTNFYGPSSDRKVNVCICEYLQVLLFTPLIGLMCGKKDKVLVEIFERSSFENMALITDDDIKSSAVKFQDMPSMEHIQSLAKLKKALNTQEDLEFYLHFDGLRMRLFKLQRSMREMNEWLKQEVDYLTPKIRLKNKEQKEGLRAYFLNQNENGKILIDDLENFLNMCFSIDTNSSKHYPFVVFPGEAATPSDIIRDLYLRIENLNSYNRKRDIQKWIFNLFFEYAGDGFSLHNIKKVTEKLPSE
jgi:hypothetical protein